MVCMIVYMTWLLLQLEDLREAIEAANAAFDKAESHMQDVERLPSSRLPRKVRCQSFL